MELMKKSKKQLKVVLTAISLFTLAGCGCFPKPPEVKVRQILQRLNVCKVYNVTFGETMRFNYEKDVPIEDCLKDGYFVLTDTELVNIRKAYNEARKCYNDQRNCKPKKGKK